MMRHLVLLLCALHLTNTIGNAQTAKVYRAGSLISTHTTLAAASAAANMIGDSILLSAHTFYEHDVPAMGGQIWQGTYTATDSTIVDAQNMGRVFNTSTIKKNRALVIRDIILTKGTTVAPEVDGGGIMKKVDSLLLRGHTIVRNCHAVRNGGGAVNAFLMDRTRLMYNTADSFGGGGDGVTCFDSTEICFNKARYGGGLSALPNVAILSKLVKLHNNQASIGGGGVYGVVYALNGCQILNNDAPVGAAIYTRPLPSLINCGSYINAYIFNPGTGPKRQNEIYINGGTLYIQGSWFGISDTIGLITQTTAFPTARDGKYAIANWSVNRGAALGKDDTLFPVGAAFTYSDGSALPPNSCPWLKGNFSTSRGTFLNPTPVMSPTDTLSSLYRTYTYGAGESGSKPVDFLCYVDRDTFKTTKLVWGRNTTGLATEFTTQQVFIYPNPVKDMLHIQGALAGSKLELYDVTGKMVAWQQCDSALTKVSMMQLAKGVYMLKIITQDGNEAAARVVKE